MSWVLALTVTAAAFISGLGGFGFGIVAMAALPLLIGLRLANVFTTVVSAVLFLVLTIPLRRSVPWPLLGRLLLGALVGVPLGIWGLVRLEEALLLRILGVLLLAYVAASLLWPAPREGRTRPLDRRWAYLAGFVGGLLSGALGSGGPPVIVFCRTQNLDKRSFKAATQVVFTLMSVYKLPLFLAAGLMSAQLGRLLLYYSPFVAAGTAGGVLLFRHLSERWFQRVILALLGLLGLTLVWRA